MFISTSKLMAEQANEVFQLPSDGRMVLRTENLVKKYGKRTVVNHVSINVKQGALKKVPTYTHQLTFGMLLLLTSMVTCKSAVS